MYMLLVEKIGAVGLAASLEKIDADSQMSEERQDAPHPHQSRSERALHVIMYDTSVLVEQEEASWVGRRSWASDADEGWG